MLHNLLIVDYGLGYPGSVHDAHAFLGTCIAQDPEGMLPPDHWIWADSAYLVQTWCAVLFKTTRLAGLSQSRNIYNKHLSKVMDHIPVGPPIDDHSPKVCVQVEHAFAALKGCFQSLRKLRLVM